MVIMKTKQSFMLIGLMLFFSIIVSSGDKKKEFKIPFEEFVLSNELNVILQVDRFGPIEAVNIGYHASLAREVQRKRGFAHLFEHLRINKSENFRKGNGSKSSMLRAPRMSMVLPARLEKAYSFTFKINQKNETETFATKLDCTMLIGRFRADEHGKGGLRCRRQGVSGLP
jgi:predicted Zn-dependent peptidase